MRLTADDFAGAMSRSKHLGGSPTSDVFGFRQTHAPQPPRRSTNLDRPPGSIRVITAALAAMRSLFPSPLKSLASFAPTDDKHQSDEQSAVGKRRFAGTALLHLRVFEQPLLTLLVIRDTGAARTICRVTHIPLLSEFAKPLPLQRVQGKGQTHVREARRAHQSPRVARRLLKRKKRSGRQYGGFIFGVANEARPIDPDDCADEGL